MFTGAVVILLGLVAAVHGQDTALGRRAAFGPKDFVYNLREGKATVGDGGKIQALNVANVPALAGEGIAYALYTIEPCGKSGGRVIENTLSKGESTFFPKGLVHFQQNTGCKEVVFLAALNHDDPGVVSVTSSLFAFNDLAVASTMGMTKKAVTELGDGVPKNPAPGRAACLRKCAGN